MLPAGVESNVEQYLSCIFAAPAARRNPAARPTRSYASRAPIDLVIRLKKWSRKKEYDRLGLRFPEDFLILGERVPQLNIPVAPGRNIATLIEVACKVHILRKRGYQAPLKIITRLERALSSGRNGR